MKNLFIVLFFLVSSTNCTAQRKMKVIYVYDALCGWCYGFSPVMMQFHEKYKESVEFDVL